MLEYDRARPEIMPEEFPLKVGFFVVTRTPDVAECTTTFTVAVGGKVTQEKKGSISAFVDHIFKV